jgi:hypothetical protein
LVAFAGRVRIRELTEWERERQEQARNIVSKLGQRNRPHRRGWLVFESLECVADNALNQRNFIVSQGLELMLAPALGQRALVLANEPDKVLNCNGSVRRNVRETMTRTAVRFLACLPLFWTHLWAQQLDVMFVLETSPGTEQQIGLIRPRDLKEGDRAGIIGYARSVYLHQPLTEDHEEIAKALQQAGMRIAIGLYSGQSPAGGRRPPGVQAVQGGTVDLSGALRQALRELGDRGSEVRKPVVIVLAANEDPALGDNLDSLRALLAEGRTRLFAIAITVGSDRAYSFPVMTAQFLDQLAKDSGGREFRGGWDLKSILAAARKP